MRQQPNILFLIADQHHAKCLGVAGHPQVRTPNLDRLAGQGIRFTSALANNPICTPSRMCFLSGQYAHNHGYYGLSGQNPGGLPTVFGHFRAAGYRTAAIGKIHCPAGWVDADCDVFREVYGKHHPSGASAYDDYLKKLGLLQDRDDGFLQEQGSQPAHQVIEGRPSRLPYQHSVESWCVQEARSFILESGGRPWFMQVSLPRPHQAYTPAREFWDLYDHDSIWLPPNADVDLSRKAPHLRRARAYFHGKEAMLFEPRTYEALRKRKQHGYLACVSQVDHAVGELMAFLDEQKLAGDTIVVYTSDHGDYASEFGVLEKAPGICGDAVCRIPSIWRLPGRFPPGQVTDAIVETVDLAPTLCALAGLAPMATADGEDLTPLLEGRKATPHSIGVTEHPWSKAVLKGHWRLVYYPRGFFGGEVEEDFGELYDLSKDPWETNNLFFEPQHRGKVAELQRDLMDWLVTTTRVKTVLPGVYREMPNTSSVWGKGIFRQHQEGDGKLPWRDIAANKNNSYK